jgi:hypothetical protein
MKEKNNVIDEKENTFIMVVMIKEKNNIMNIKME